MDFDTLKNNTGMDFDTLKNNTGMDFDTLKNKLANKYIGKEFNNHAVFGLLLNLSTCENYDDMNTAIEKFMHEHDLLDKKTYIYDGDDIRAALIKALDNRKRFLK